MDLSEPARTATDRRQDPPGCAAAVGPPCAATSASGAGSFGPKVIACSAATTLDAGVPLRDVQDYARHRDARTTRRYDHSRDTLVRSAAYPVAAYLG